MQHLSLIFVDNKYLASAMELKKKKLRHRSQKKICLDSRSDTLFSYLSSHQKKNNFIQIHSGLEATKSDHDGHGFPEAHVMFSQDGTATIHVKPEE